MGKFIIADNQELTRYALEQLIGHDSAGETYSAYDKAGLVCLLKDHGDAVVVIDYTLFDITDEEQLLIIAERFPQSQWVLLSEELTPQFMRRVVYSSRRFSIVFKDGMLRDIRDALLTALRGERFVSQRVMEAIIDQRQEDEKPDLLTATEIEIVKGIALGKTTKEIAAERFSSIHTVTTHRKNIFRKLGVNTAHEVVKYALRAGLIDASEFYI